MSAFSDLINDPPIEVFEVTRSFNEDKNGNKVNLGVGGIMRLQSIYTRIIHNYFFFIIYS